MKQQRGTKNGESCMAICYIFLSLSSFLVYKQIKWNLKTLGIFALVSCHREFRCVLFGYDSYSCVAGRAIPMQHQWTLPLLDGSFQFINAELKHRACVRRSILATRAPISRAKFQNNTGHRSLQLSPTSSGILLGNHGAYIFQYTFNALNRLCVKLQTSKTAVCFLSDKIKTTEVFFTVCIGIGLLSTRRGDNLVFKWFGFVTTVLEIVSRIVSWKSPVIWIFFSNFASPIRDAGRKKWFQAP